MTAQRAERRNRLLRLGLCAGAALGACGCVAAPDLRPLSAGDVNPNSSVAAEVDAASRSPGPYPRFEDIPPVATDVRTVPQWRQAVISEWAIRRQTEAEAAAIPFVLAGSEAWAESMRAKIPQGETVLPPPNSGLETEAFANSERARATPPPPPQ